jgi:hypothetical protein
MQLSEDPPVRHHHPNNGVILAVNKTPTQDEDGEIIVYARCTSCRFSHTTNAHAVRVMRGKDSEFASPWLKLSRESFSAMLEASGENSTGYNVKLCLLGICICRFLMLS